MRNEFTILAFVFFFIISIAAWFGHPGFAWAYAIWLPLTIGGIYDMVQTRHAIARNFPILGRGRYIAEWFRPKILQYFVEPDTEGRPFSRLNRNIIYQRAKKQTDTTPFGTQLDVYEEGYEWMAHSIAAIDNKSLDHHPRVTVGGKDCKRPYDLSILNVSAMSFGSLSKNAVMALNGGARIGKFAHNTGEGGISPYHLEPGGDLIYQVGTGYFGCRSAEGGFDPDVFAETVAPDNIKMIELKLSQGAKPGHGGILPAAKNTPEIAAIRKVKPGVQVDSPPFHRAFNTPIGLLELLSVMRERSGGRPVGFKLCVGNRHEFIAICKAMLETGIRPDFITVDGGEGGTGAAPLEFSNFVGMPFREGLAFVHDALTGFDLRRDIRVLASGKIASGFDLFRARAIGADACNSARAMMMALGCIQALECNKNTCPTGVATQNPELVSGLVVADKRVRVANYHKNTVESFVELMAAAGVREPAQINRSMINRRVLMNITKRYDEIYPPLPPGCLLHADSCPPEYADLLKMTSAQQFGLVQPIFYHS
jgi:glutamate synthase domain-containing protein 2